MFDPDPGPTVSFVPDLAPKDLEEEISDQIPGDASLAVLQRLRAIRQRSVDPEGIPFGPFTLFGVMGRGGMAEVRLALQAQAGGSRPAVVKRMLPEIEARPTDRRLFDEEGRVCARLDHPNIVQLYDRGEIEGVPFLAFELIDGLTLRELTTLIAPERLPLRAVLEIGIAIADGLACAHGARGPDGCGLDVVHRDLSPHNVLVARGGTVKLVDFGIARFSGRAVQTGEGELRGKLGYMAPEQYDPGPIDGRADLFALGLVLAELVGGERVFPPAFLVPAETEPAIRACMARARYPVPDPLRELIVEVTSVDPHDRVQTAFEVGERLRIEVAATAGEGLTSYVSRAAFARFPPLDLSTLAGVSSRRVRQGGTEPLSTPASVKSGTVAPRRHRELRRTLRRRLKMRLRNQKTFRVWLGRVGIWLGAFILGYALTKFALWLGGVDS